MVSKSFTVLPAQLKNTQTQLSSLGVAQSGTALLIPLLEAIFIFMLQIANTLWIIKKGREFQKSIYFCFIDYAKAFDCVDHNKLWKILQEMGIPEHLTCLLRNLYAGQEATVRTGHGTTDWFQIGKEVHQGYILSPAYLTYIQSTS